MTDTPAIFKKITPETLRDAGQSQINQCLTDLCMDRAWIRTALRTRPDSLNVSQFVSVFNKMERPDRVRIFNSVKTNFLSWLIAAEKNKDTIPYAIASCDLINRCLRTVQNDAIINAVESLWHKALLSGNANLQRNAAHGLGQFAPLRASHDLNEALKNGASVKDILPSLIRAKSFHTPLEALEDLSHPNCPPDLNGLIYAKELALKNAFQADAQAVIKALPRISLAWSEDTRKIIGQLLEAPEYLQFGAVMTKVAQHLKNGNAAPTASRNDTPWRRYLSKSIEKGAVNTHYLEFAAPSGAEPPRALIKYRNAFTRVVTEAAGVGRLSPDHSVPREINQAVDDHFHGITPILDLQWNTPSRNDIGLFLQLGVFDKFAVVCRSDRLKEFLQETMAAEVSVTTALKEARADTSNYVDGALKLSKLVELHNNQTITLVTQDSSALNDLVDRGVIDSASGNVPRSRLGGTSGGKLAVDILRTILSSERPMVGLIEWNLLRTLAADPETFFEEAQLWSRLEDALIEDNVSFKYFRGQLDTPLGAGYFSPNDDLEYQEAVFLAARDAFTHPRGDQLEWNRSIQSFAKMSLVQLDSAMKVFDSSLTGRQNLVSHSTFVEKQAKKAQSL